MSMNRKHTVLVVDDVEMNQQLAQKILESWGLTVLLAGNGKEALEKFSGGQVDLILMDIQMPEMDGIEATRKIRETSAVPVIALTANTSPEDTKNYFKAGMNDCIAKPVEEKHLLAVLSTYISFGANKEEEQMAESTEEESLYDFKLVEEISGGDQEFVKRMMGMFVETVPQLLAELQLSVQEKAWDRTWKTAHRMKSTIDSMNIRSIKQEIRQIEANGKQQVQLDELPMLTDKVARVLEACFEAVKKELAH